MLRLKPESEMQCYDVDAPRALFQETPRLDSDSSGLDGPRDVVFCGQIGPNTVDHLPCAACRREDHYLRQNIFIRCEDRSSPDIDVARLDNDRYIRRYKRIFDLVFAIGLLLLTLPAWLAVALIIKLDSPGPILFQQTRTGYLGRRFRMFKFRTMVADAEQRKTGLAHLNIHGPGSPDFKIANDPRVTRVGRILRKASLDELPNLINVLTGEMSIVGPRPTSFDASTYGTPHLSRLAIKPGITGLWQVSGRADVDFDQRTLLDVRYINNASFALDMKMVFITLLRIRNGAY